MSFDRWRDSFFFSATVGVCEREDAKINISPYVDGNAYGATFKYDLGGRTQSWTLNAIVRLVSFVCRYGRNKKKTGARASVALPAQGVIIRP